MKIKELLKLSAKLAPKEKFSIGLDIGSSFIKAVKLKISKDICEVEDFAVEPAGANISGALRRMRVLQEVKSVSVSISGPATILRYVLFPQMNNEDLNKALKFEAQKYIPFSVAELNLDSYILKDNLPDNKMLVMLAGAKKDFITERLKITDEAGIRTGLVDIDSVALINAFTYNNQDEVKTIALVNIGANFTNLSILEDSLPRLSRDIQFGGNNITQKLADAFTIEFSSAEQLKLSPEPAKAEKISAVESALLSSLATEIRTSFDYYESQSSSSVAKIYLSGGSSLGAGIKDTLANLLGIEVECWDPLKKLSLSSRIDADKIKACSGQLSVALGLILREI
jgi:type IV pilus assembly protein PilM